MINYEDIAKVNADVEMIDLKGKKYAMVPQRVKAFRRLFPEGFITTEIISHDGVTVMMQAKAGYYEDGVPIILATGFAQEVKGKGMVNSTSYIENCETSAVGRALGMISLGIEGGGICSAEELANAVVAQQQMKEEERAFCNPPMPEDGPVTSAKTLPKKAQTSPVGNYIMNEITAMQEETGAKTYGEMKTRFNEWVKALEDAKVIDKVDWQTITLEQAKQIVAAIRKNFLSGDAA